MIRPAAQDQMLEHHELPFNARIEAWVASWFPVGGDKIAPTRFWLSSEAMPRNSWM
jgi:hypothetical protein